MTTPAPENTHHRTIRSFVLRTGRLTKGQEQAIETGWSTLGIDEGTSTLDYQALFQRTAPVVFEIGFGNGETLAQMAKAMPEYNFIGVEVHTPGVGHLLHLLQRDQLNNVRVINTDAVEILKQRIAPQSLERVQIFFPDPWHKKRHHKRRIIQTEFVELLVSRLTTNGLIHLATDWEPYAQHMAEVLDANPQLKRLQADSPFVERPAHRPLTKFEQRGQRLGHGVWDLIYQRV
ncbi:tRNA (guanosine(46)-N7)-methyltransferase TrmB [Thiofilum flexile]|uniref:tRNA (guanosine(46)-N7)-methyltransferase TrmB n=1 Tax=Thiofilum flexile TaxID=125627 RepID=UPI0003752342|nr:tRNA (guanosine(46)-N7)-methyltransferase TrmB [Thiofilum flexile]